MNHEQKIRYGRHLLLDEIGEAGQNKLLLSKVLVVGAGGLGSPLLLYLAASGVGTIGIVDDDRVDLSNLQRQILFEMSDIGSDKTGSAKYALHDLNPEINIKCYNERLGKDNISDIALDYDLIADCSDNIKTRFLLNEFCHINKKTLVSAAIHRFQGHLHTFKSYLGADHPCYKCIYPNIEDVNLQLSCSDQGVFAALAGVMGSMQAVCVIKELLNLETSLSGKMIIYDALSLEQRKISVRRHKNCNVCSGN
jgi:molybdopterin/thiamine biosynthesis adenylyltransferase